MDIPKTSRAAVVAAFNAPVEIRDLPIPEELEPGAILVKTAVASMCGSDVHFVEGASAMDLPAVLGHEMVGTIVRQGAQVITDSIGQPIKVGDNIVWEHSSCGTCYGCSVLGSGSLCSNRKMYSHESCAKFPYLVGGFADYVYVYPTSRRLRVPDDLPAAWASISSCALRTVMHGFERLGHVESSHTALIQGVGPLGLFMTAVLDHAGVDNIIAVDLSAQRLALAKKWGARHTISIAELPKPSDRANAVMGIAGGRGADILVEVSGATGAFAEGLDCAALGARYVMIGSGGKPAPLQSSKIVQRNLNIMGIRSAEIRHYYKAFEFMLNTRARYDFSEMISGEYRLDQINEALANYKGGQEIKPLVIP